MNSALYKYVLLLLLFNLLVIIHLLISARQLFNFEIASNGCRQRKHDNQSYDTLKWRSEAINPNKILNVLNLSLEEDHK